MKLGTGILAAAAVAGCIVATSAAAQDVRYLSPYFNFEAGDPPGIQFFSDVIVKEEWAGGEIRNAELDFCFATQGKPPVRALIALTPFGDRLEGESVVPGAGTRVRVRLLRKKDNLEVSYSGSLAFDGNNAEFQSNPTFEVSAAEFKLADDAVVIEERPADFTLLSPNTLAVKIRYGSLPEWTKAVRSLNALLDLQAAALDNRACAEMRLGFQIFRLSVPPENVADAIAKLKAMPMVLEVGHTHNIAGYRTQIRLPKRGWFTDGKLDRPRFAEAFGKVAAEALGATLVASVWDPSTGELMLELKRPSRKFSGLGFTDVIPVRLLAAADRPGETDRFAVWIGETMARLADETPGSRLSLAPLYFYAGPPEGIPIELDELVSALAQAFKAEVWNANDERWQ